MSWLHPLNITEPLVPPRLTLIRGSLKEEAVPTGGCSSVDAQAVHQNNTILNDVPIVASKDKIVSVASSLNRDKHCAVHVVIEGEKQVLQERNGKSLPGSIRGQAGKRHSKSLVVSKGVMKVGSKAKNNYARGIQNLLIADRISTLSSELDQAKQAEHRALKSPMVRTVSDPTHVIWHENSSFNQEGNDKMHE
ncbi:hypothetical protein V6N12_017763 [Hibiscus sabdariffa]|uniref:Uncharacterized protein n=1 Tax=Hibiscus sabdariffa TaxID=183260 RepID=A0ABR2BBI4_9ROSI